MLLFIEGYPYNLDHMVRENLMVRDILEDVVSFAKVEPTQSFGYIGYCYSKKVNDVVFFLPKVVLTGKDVPEDETIFGASPYEIIDFESKNIKSKFDEDGFKEYKEFLSNLSIWIYRTISVYKQTNNENILESREYQRESRGKKQKHNTLLDVIIALRDFNKNNQDYLTFIAKSLHSGHNMIQWNKTITHTTAIIQNGRPVYVDPINKKKVVNFDEELLVIYFSVLNYIAHTHGFSFEINLQYQLISPEKIKKTYIGKNLGCRRLKQIKYKYFSDKALRIWDLCYAFFVREYKIALNLTDTDFLLAKDFDHIFEVMIDTLVGGDDKSKLPLELVDQKDGKLVDHMFIGKGLIEQSDLPTDLTYYIGDSKYYKRGQGGSTTIGDHSIYKQYTYARNVIQWNMKLFLDGDNTEQPQLRDELTEGYNPIPNFFISARIPSKNENDKFLSFDDGRLKEQSDSVQLNRQFENRLFDRDTLLLTHYDVNFLFIVSLYGRNNKNKQAVWRENVRTIFREKIQKTLNDNYEFYILQPKTGMNCYEFVRRHFYEFNGKIYRPFKNANYLVLALMRGNGNLFNKLQQQIKNNNDYLGKSIVTKEQFSDNLKDYFDVSDPVELSDSLKFNVLPEEKLGSLEKPSANYDEFILTGMTRDWNVIESCGIYHVPIDDLILSEGFPKVKWVYIYAGKIKRFYKVKSTKSQFLSNSELSKKTGKTHKHNVYLVYELNVPSHDLPDGIKIDDVVDNLGGKTRFERLGNILKRKK